MAVRARRWRMRRNLRYVQRSTSTHANLGRRLRHRSRDVYVHTYRNTPVHHVVSTLKYLKYPASASDKQETHVLTELSRTRAVYTRPYVLSCDEKRNERRKRGRETNSVERLEKVIRLKKKQIIELIILALWISSFSFSLPPFLSFSHYLCIFPLSAEHRSFVSLPHRRGETRRPS